MLINLKKIEAGCFYDCKKLQTINSKLDKKQLKHSFYDENEYNIFLKNNRNNKLKQIL